MASSEIHPGPTIRIVQVTKTARVQSGMSRRGWPGVFWRCVATVTVSNYSKQDLASEAVLRFPQAAEGQATPDT